MGPRDLISGTRSKRLTGAKGGGGGFEEVGQKTSLDLMEAVHPGKS